MGLLWMRRTLAFLLALLENLVAAARQGGYATNGGTTAAVDMLQATRAAYQATLERHLSYRVQLAFEAAAAVVPSYAATLASLSSASADASDLEHETAVLAGSAPLLKAGWAVQLQLERRFLEMSLEDTRVA